MVVDDAFVAIAHRIVWRSGSGRDDGLVGWITTRPTPLKLAHLEHSPHVSCSYWDATQDTAIAECDAEWVDDVDTRAHAWELFRAAPEPLGHDPYSIWPEGPADPDAGVLRLKPWRLRVATMETLLGRAPVLRRSLEGCPTS